MNKLTKRLAAIGAAMTMAVSMMSMGASAAYSSSWSSLQYAPTMPSGETRLSSSASVQAREAGATLSVNATITRVGNAYMYASAYKANNSQSIYATGSYYLYFSAANYPKGSYKTVSVSLKNYTGNSIYASGTVSN